ncbi:MAG: LITAF-like zinc ribbon domain-containing protein [Dehalococcoidales bacterium]|nr:LITAF-like zinc ribbon domain-containing protein [Dehalococcoidales bacterium]
MQCPNCDTPMDYMVVQKNILEFLGCVGCLGCIVSPLGCLLAPLAFFLPKDKYYLCPNCGHREKAK